jgi:hypothetical protein
MKLYRLAKDAPKPGPTPGMKIKKFETNIFNFFLGGRKTSKEKKKKIGMVETKRMV